MGFPGLRLNRGSLVRFFLGGAVGSCALLGVLAVGAAPASAADPTGRATLIAEHGTVSLFDSAVRLTPGASRESCLRVAAEGQSRASSVHLWAEQVAGELAPHLQVQVDAGSGGGGGTCRGFAGHELFRGSLQELADARSAGGVDSGWTPVGHDARTFRFTVHVVDSAPQGRSAAAVFVWQNSWDADPSRGTGDVPEEEGAGPLAPPRPETVVSGPPEVGPISGTTAPTRSGPPLPTGGPATSVEATSGGGEQGEPPRPQWSAAPGSVPALPSGGSATRPPTGPADAGNGPAVDVELRAPWSRLRVPWADRVDATKVVPTLQALVRNPAYPLSVLAAVALFLVVQHRLDARDPKLLLAPTTRTLLAFHDPRQPDPLTLPTHPAPAELED